MDFLKRCVHPMLICAWPFYSVERLWFFSCSHHFLRRLFRTGQVFFICSLFRLELTLFCRLRKNGKETFWRNKANEVSKKMKDYLWVPERKAYFYRNKKNEFVYSLAHNNIRTMYFGTMDQTMADDFIRYHLLNPD